MPKLSKFESDWYKAEMGDKPIELVLNQKTAEISSDDLKISAEVIEVNLDVERPHLSGTRESTMRGTHCPNCGAWICGGEFICGECGMD